MRITSADQRPSEIILAYWNQVIVIEEDAEVCLPTYFEMED